MRDRGFTLIELIIVIIIVGILAAAGSRALVLSVDASLINQENISSLTKLRYGVERIARELREASYSTSTSTLSLSSTTWGTATAVTFTKNYPSYSITIATSGACSTSSTCSINMTYGSPAVGPVTLVDRVSSFQIAYYQTDGTTAATSTGDTTFAEITMAVTNSYGVTYTERSRVMFRNKTL